MQVSGYQFPLDPPLHDKSLFLGFPTSWGWGTWARAWKRFDADARGYETLKNDSAARHRFDLDGSYPYFAMLERQLAGDIDSWAIRWHLSVFMHQGLVLYPGRSLVRNIGFDGSGTHGAAGSGFADEAVGNAGAEDWQFPPVALQRDAQARITSFLAHQTAHARSRQLKNLASKWTRTLLANRLVPPSVRAVGNSLLARVTGGTSDAGNQDLDLYWDPKMAAILETWGIGNTWNEIQLLLANLHGKIVDIACGTGKVMTFLDAYPALEVHGFDVSDFLIQKAIDRGIPRERLAVADATKTHYPDNAFDYGYSIGSLEHFTEDGILQFVKETYRISRYASFHQIPISRSGRNEGWMKTHQSFHNNSVDWWLERYRSTYPTVHVLDSAWNDKISVGKWFLCVKEERR
jgi:SAM-dependent methyltransferase